LKALNGFFATDASPKQLQPMDQAIAGRHFPPQYSVPEVLAAGSDLFGGTRSVALNLRLLAYTLILT
jgi:hypothetical protein